MEFNRNQYFFLGIVVLLMGVQLRMVSTFVLTDDATRFLAERTRSSSSEQAFVSLSSDMGTLSKKVIQPPEWLGWCLISIGSVLVLQSLAMKRPD